jgi:hypothetical protein
MILDYIFGYLFAWALRGFRVLRRHRLVARAQNWPKASGRGLWAQAKSTSSPFPSNSIWSAEIGYSYVVDGEYYSGLASLPADDEKHAEGLALGWEDREIVVRYSPPETTLSTLLTEDQNQPLRVLPKARGSLAFSFAACSKSQTQTPDSPETAPPLFAVAPPSAPEPAGDSRAPAGRNNQHQ